MHKTPVACRLEKQPTSAVGAINGVGTTELPRTLQLLRAYEASELGTYAYDLTDLRQEKDPLRVSRYTRRVQIGAAFPVYRQPRLPMQLQEQKDIVLLPKQLSLLPLLIAASQVFRRITVPTMSSSVCTAAAAPGGAAATATTGSAVLSSDDDTKQPLGSGHRQQGLSWRDFDFITERSGLNKITKRDEWFQIGVQRIDNTVFFRRFVPRATQNYGDIGFQFENACAPGGDHHTEYHTVLDTRVGDYRILLSAEIDAVKDTSTVSSSTATTADSVSGHHDKALPLSGVPGFPDVGAQSNANDATLQLLPTTSPISAPKQRLEIKCTSRHPREWKLAQRRQVWVQCFFGAIDTLIIGHKVPSTDTNPPDPVAALAPPPRSIGDHKAPVIVVGKVQEVAVASLITDADKEAHLQHLHSVLYWVRQHVVVDQVYHLQRQRSPNGPELVLLQCIAADSFVNKSILSELFPFA